MSRNLRVDDDEQIEILAVAPAPREQFYWFVFAATAFTIFMFMRNVLDRRFEEAATYMVGVAVCFGSLYIGEAIRAAVTAVAMVRDFERDREP